MILTVTTQFSNLPRRTIPEPDPNHFWRISIQKATLAKIRIFAHNCVGESCCEIPHGPIRRRLKSKVSHVRRTWKGIVQNPHEVRRQVLVEEQDHAGIEIRRRSRSAAKARQARISSAVKSGKSARISASVIPEAR